mmetsp:Transcript_50509/g.127334  ORF Transcript_50509/g.127334 Transcript_50509/m.127334 type:complete len:242 (-) Transcript_50509:1098-1823(-)
MRPASTPPPRLPLLPWRQRLSCRRGSRSRRVLQTMARSWCRRQHRRMALLGSLGRPQSMHRCNRQRRSTSRPQPRLTSPVIRACWTRTHTARWAQPTTGLASPQTARRGPISQLMGLAASSPPLPFSLPLTSQRGSATSQGLPARAPHCHPHLWPSLLTLPPLLERWLQRRRQLRHSAMPEATAPRVWRALHTGGSLTTATTQGGRVGRPMLVRVRPRRVRTFLTSLPQLQCSPASLVELM